MKLKSRDLLFVVIVVVVVGGLYFLSTRSRVPVLSAQPSEHQTAKAREDCLQCHLPEKMDALETARKHPLKWRDQKVSCLQCHQPPKQVSQHFSYPVSPVTAAEPQVSNFQSQISHYKSSWLKQQ